jgi:hypothetical protein
MQRLTKIDDTFLVTGRGLVVVPGPRRADVAGGTDIPVELHRPDGTRMRARASLTHTFQSPPPPPHIAEQWTCILFGVSKDDVPLGTEIWSENAV